MDAQPHFFDGQLSTLLNAWSTTIEHISELAGDLTDEQWALETRCPGWTVGDITAHVVGLERRLVGDDLPTPEPDWTSLPHIKSDEFTRFMERDVDLRRGLPRSEVVAELVEVIPRRRAQLLALDADPDLLVAGPAGSQVPFGRIMPVRVFDLWIHEQDIRQAIDAPGGAASIGAHVTAETLVSTLPVIWAKKVGAQSGQSLHLTVSGGISFECDIVVDADGRAAFVTREQSPTTSINLEWLTYAALSTGRVSLDSVWDEIVIHGDSDLARKTLESVNIAP